MAVFVTLHWTEKTEHCITQEAQGTEENIDLHKDLILFQEICLYNLAWHWCTPDWWNDLLLLLSPLPSVSLLFKYKPAATGQPDSAILFEHWLYCGHQECFRVIWEQTHNYTITVTVMLAVKYWCFILLALIKSDLNFCFGGLRMAVTSRSRSASFPTSPPPSVWNRLIQAFGQSTHVLTSHGLLVGWRRCSGASHIKGANGPQSLWLPGSAVHNGSCSEPHIPRPQIALVCVCLCTYLCLHQRFHARHVWCNSGSRDQYVISENTLPVFVSTHCGRGISVAWQNQMWLD